MRRIDYILVAQLGIAARENANYVWRFVDGKPLRRKRGQPVLAQTPISDALSKDLSKRGFKFVGSTICYSFMQAVGMVNDHDLNCFRYSEV